MGAETEMIPITTDEGTSNAKQTPLESFGFSGPDQPQDAIMQRCIRCGFCLPTCPTYVETFREASSPRGRIHLIQAVASGDLALTDPTFISQMYECLDCRACEAVCPSGVEYGQLVETARTQIERARPRPFWQFAARALIFDGLFADNRRFRQMGGLLRFYQRFGARWLARRSGALGLLGLRDLEALPPDLPDAFFTPDDRSYPPLAGVARRGRVALFAGCVMGTVFALTDRATIRVLNINGYEVVVPSGQQCCGAITTHSGEMERARALAMRNIQAFEQSGADYIVINAAGCGSALKEYGRLLGDDATWQPRAAAFAGRVRDVSELLGELLAQGELNTHFEPLPLRVTYQDACHLAHAQRISSQPRALLEAIPGLELVEMEESALCCGSAGVYNITRQQMAAQLGKRKVAHVLATQAQAVVTANPGCQLQMRALLRQAGAEMAVLHIVDVLDAAYRGRPPEML
ncbi:MAG: heterodisulfide reductase-related iron-sulfur binding cluster [Ktedonobacterales bacterium]